MICVDKGGSDVVKKDNPGVSPEGAEVGFKRTKVEHHMATVIIERLLDPEGPDDNIWIIGDFAFGLKSSFSMLSVWHSGLGLAKCVIPNGRHVASTPLVLLSRAFLHLQAGHTLAIAP